MKDKLWALFLLAGWLAGCQPDPNEYALYKAAAFSEVARVQFRNGHVAAARATARFASQTVAAISEQERSDFLKIIEAVAHVRANDGAAASRVIAGLEETCLGPPVVALAQADIGARMDAVQSVEAALLSVDSNTNGCDRATIRTITAWAQAKVGDTTGALETIAKISRPRAKDEAFALVSEVLLNIGDLQKALEVANLISNAEADSDIQISILLVRGIALDPGRAADSIQSDFGIPPAVRALVNVAAALSTSGDAAGAQRTIERVLEVVNEPIRSEDQVRASALVAVALWQSGDPAAAQRILSSVTQVADDLPLHGRSGALSAIAAAQFSTSDIEGGSKTLDQIPQGDDRTSALMRVATLQASKGNISNALHILDYPLNPLERLNVLTAIASSQAQSGNLPNASRSIALAQDTLVELDAPGPPYFALLLLSKAQAEAGNVEAALATAGSIHNVY